MSCMLPHWRAFDIEVLCEQNGLMRTRDWIRAVLSRESVVESAATVEEMARASRLYYVSYVSPGAVGSL